MPIDYFFNKKISQFIQPSISWYRYRYPWHKQPKNAPENAPIHYTVYATLTKGDGQQKVLENLPRRVFRCKKLYGITKVMKFSLTPFYSVEIGKKCSEHRSVQYSLPFQIYLEYILCANERLIGARVDLNAVCWMCLCETCQVGSCSRAWLLLVSAASTENREREIMNGMFGFLTNSRFCSCISHKY